MRIFKGKNLKLILVVAVIFVAVTAIFTLNNTGDCLVIKDANTGKTIASYELFEGGKFSVGFKHSVNQSLVEDRYVIENSQIMVYETLYYHFGAGVQSEILEGQTLTQTDDGGMVVGNINTVMTNLIYSISPVYDHILKINEQEISLKELCGDTRHILLEYKN
ncbi:MAG: DUF1850 domain-containing protein [Clostridia bacterium]